MAPKQSKQSQQSQQSQQQEMVQAVARLSSRATPSFWGRQTSPPERPPQSSLDGDVVVGASYSHADILKGATHGRPRSPPASSKPASSSQRNKSKPPIRQATGDPISRRFGPYEGLYPQSDRPWIDSHDNQTQDDDDDFFVYDDAEDEFGLPSLTTAHNPRTMLRSQTTDARDKCDDYPNGASASIPITAAPRLRANSSDIAEERGSLVYPTSKPSERKILRPQYKEILKDPANALNLIDHSAPPRDLSPTQQDAHSTRINRINKFKRILQSSTVPLSELRDLAWSGVPREVRAMTWQLLLGYLPTNSERRVSTLERKRNEYLEGVRQAFDRGATNTHEPALMNQLNTTGPSKANVGGRRGLDEAIWHQIRIDIPRTNPQIALYSYEATQRSLERILYVWAIRHPASGYVQGINDLATPFWQVFLATYVTDFDIEEGMDPGQVPKPVLNAVEADTFWCLTKLLDGIQDNYIYAQPGIHRQVNALHGLVRRIDYPLANHLENEGVEFMQFSFRWMNCLLMREINFKNTIRMWDTYLAQDQGFSRFHLYVCAAFLVKWSEQLLKLDFQEIMMFLQAPPTQGWTEKEIELLLSEAFIWQSLFQDSAAHLRSGYNTTTTTAGAAV